ncbi:S41 family peptidase [Pedobacter rhodius]|uniref:S41 family peptidase n=1 Tax=Pedobacter rhodius TaxID=3004098 RepID=A0ABT4L073_9SPHI|nr:S41 family peptidase [Pedobacter sp. SJ11]MCZ4223847.1 S41 family peptidase [Pedobacter sp. SJ11]
MKNFLLIALLLCSCKIYSQLSINGSFEELDGKRMPKGWLFSFDDIQKKAYPVAVDSLIKQDGKYSLSIEKKGVESSYGVIDYPVTQIFDGKKIELRAYLKTEGISAGYAGLWVRIDDASGKVIAFDNMGERGVKGTTDWKQYSIKLDYNSDEIKTLHFGGLLSGDGKAWFDNFQIFIDNKPLSAVQLKKIVMPKAELDTAFANGSGIKDFKLSEQISNNLIITGQFWGFLKYYHPAIAKGDYNWDAELFRLLPSVINAKSNRELSTEMEKFLDRLPKPDLCKNCNKIVNESYEIKPDYGALFDNKIINASLLEKLTYVKENRNTGKNYYIEMAPGVSNPVFKNEKPYLNMSYPDAGYRLLSLYRYWAMINYFFPYKDVIGQDWNNALKSSLADYVNAKNELDYGKAVLKLIAKVNDTHANLWNGSKAINEFKGKYAPPLQAKFIEGKLIITALHTDTLDVKSKLKIGDVIASIQGKDINSLIKEYLALTPASNYDTQLRDLPINYLLRSNETSLNIKVNRDGNMFDYNLPMGKLSQVYKNPDFEKAEAYKLIDENTGYVFPGKYKNAMLADIKKKFENTKGIIVDMRCYPSEFMPFTFGNYIKSTSTPFVKFTMGSVDYPGSFKFGPALKNGQMAHDNYKGKVVVIVNSTSQSQAEYTTMAFQSSPNVKVIGSTTAGADGNVSAIVLPGGLRTMISGIGVFYPDGKPTQRVGVKIDEVIYPTINGIKQGKDELLEKAIETLNKGW